MRHGRFYDPYRGDGCFVSFRIPDGFLLFGVRWRWHFYRVDLDFKRRWYFGPFEIEKSKTRSERYRAAMPKEAGDND